MTTRSLDDIISYEKQALDLIPTDHPNYEEIISYEKQALDLLPPDHPHYVEIRALLMDQINDELYDYAHTISDS